MSDPTFQIPKEIINPIIQAHVNEAVIKALDGPQQIVTRAIANVLMTKVDSNGKHSTYGDARPWIDWVIGDCIQKAARGAVEEFLTENKDKIKAELVAQLSKKNSPLVKQMVEGMVNGMCSESNLRWNLNVTASTK
jgi:hypothetical protein